MRLNLAFLSFVLVALAAASPARLQTWVFEGGGLHPQSASLGILALHPAALSAEMDGDGAPEVLVLQDGRALIRRQAQTLWSSPEGWQVTTAAMTDLDRDGHPEATLLVWRPFQPWPVDRVMPFAGRIAGFHDRDGRSCHLILIGWRRGAFRELWAGSALAEPLSDFAAADLHGDGLQELVALETAYDAPPAAAARSLSAWEWNGFGFTVLARQPGPFKQMHVGAGSSKPEVILTTNP